jgi:DNA polymerase type B, organellar and viral
MKIVFDTEIFPNYFLIMFKSIETGKVISFEHGLGKEIDKLRLQRIITNNHTLIGFNSENFDLPLIDVFLKYQTVEDVYKACQAIIESNLKGWQVRKNRDIYATKVDSIDLIELTALRPSLKMLGVRMGHTGLENLPVEPGTVINEDQAEIIKKYCLKDLALTEKLYHKLEGAIALRENMGKTYGVELRSKSDAQLAEAIFKVELKREGIEARSPDFFTDIISFKKPDFIRFETNELNEVLDTIINGQFVTDNSGKPIPVGDNLKALFKKPIKVGDLDLQLGMGGIHSCESNIAYIADKHTRIIDRDVDSYYPSIIINQGLHPKQYGKTFNDIYQKIVTKRLKAKKEKNTLENNCLKIVINGLYGKFGSPYSIVYAPDLLLQTTLTGQLCLLMLIEKLTSAGIKVISANTDGVVSVVNKSQQKEFDEIIHDWELITNFQTSETVYSRYNARDVNNYVAVYHDGFNYKSKGIFSPTSLTKSPAGEVAYLAVINALTLGIPVDEFIRSQRDTRLFLIGARVSQGAVLHGYELDDRPLIERMAELGYVNEGKRFYRDCKFVTQSTAEKLTKFKDLGIITDYGKIVRWYYSTDTTYNKLEHKVSGNQVAGSDGGKVLMDITDFPKDIDYQRYIDVANKLLAAWC